MFNLRNCLFMFLLVIPNSKFIIKKRRQISASDIAIFVNRSRQNSSTMFIVKNRIICAASEKRYPKRGSRNYHFILNVREQISFNNLVSFNKFTNSILY